MPPGEENGEGKPSGNQHRSPMMKSVSAPAQLQNPHPLSRQMATREFEFDPISLKEPEDLHSWNWLGYPSRFISYLLHKSVQEVDGRDQHCALLFWILIVLGFFAYGAFLFAGAIEQRDNPPQSFELLYNSGDLQPFSHLPYLVVCPQLNWKKLQPSLGAVVHLRVSSKGWVTRDPDRVDYKGIHRAAIEDYAVKPLENSECVDDGCFYFDGPAYSKYPDETIALETRWISILAMIRIPEAKKDNWSVMGVPTYATTHHPAQKCENINNVTTMSVMTLTHRLPDRREFSIDRIRLKFIRNILLKDHYHVLPKQSTYPDDLVDMEYVGADTAHKAWNETLEKEEPGYDTFAGAMSFRITPNVYQYKRLEPVNILALLCAIAGIWTAFVLSFKLLFPSDGGRRRRVIKILRPWVSRIMPRKKTEAMQCLAGLLPPDAEDRHGPFSPPDGVKRRSTSTSGGEDADAHARSAEEGRAGMGAPEELKEATSQDQHDGRLRMPRLPPLFPKRPGFSFMGRGRPSSHHDGPDERLVLLELPGPDERLHQLEQTVKLIVEDMHRRQSLQYTYLSDLEGEESRGNNSEIRRGQSAPFESP